MPANEHRPPVSTEEIMIGLFGGIIAISVILSIWGTGGMVAAVVVIALMYKVNQKLPWRRINSVHRNLDLENQPRRKMQP